MENHDIRQIGRYQLLDVIGQGGMGIVYRAVDASIGRTVAIKMLRGDYADDKDLLARFHREVRFTANLQHKNIVTVYALDDYEGSPCMVMEYLEGRSISDMIKARQPMPLFEKIGLICQVCDGLQYAHGQNVIHRDIKPANVLVLKDGLAKIVDFGIARIAMGETLTRTGQVIGSLPYMSPEQLNGAAVDARTDIYSTGVMIFEFLSGELPFKVIGHDQQTTISKILNDPVPSLRRFLANYPDGLDEILQKAMAKSPHARYQSAEDLGYELSRLQEGLKRGMTEQHLSQAKAAMERRDWEQARQQLQELLKSDRRHSEANELLVVVRREIQQLQKSAQLEQLQSQAQIAVAGRQYEEALECVAQALQLDPENRHLAAFSQSIKLQVAQAQELAEALLRGYGALYAGDLDGATLAVGQALRIDTGHTEALALESLVRKEMEERRRRVQLQDLLEDARGKISSHDYLSALRSLQKAQEIEPADSNIRELIGWASRGHEQEKVRKELQKWTSEIGQLLDKDQHAEALTACTKALEIFPEEPSILKLQQLARRNAELTARRQAIDKAGAEARRLTEAGRSEEALSLLAGALAAYPGDQSLETLLSMTRAEAEREGREREERVQERRADAERDARNPGLDSRQGAAQLLEDLEVAVSRKLPFSQQRLLVERLAAAAANNLLNPTENQRYSQAVAEFAPRAAQWARDCEELGAIHLTVREAKSNAEISSLLDKARTVAEKYEKDEEIRNLYRPIRQFAEQFRLTRETVVARISGLIRSMEGGQQLAVVRNIEQQVQQAAAPWIGDAAIQELAHEARVHAQEAGQRQTYLLQELAHLTESISAARSAGQIRMLEEQATILSADTEESDVTQALNHLRRVAEARRKQHGELIARLKDLALQAATAPTLAEAEKQNAAAKSLLSAQTETEDTGDLLRRIQHTVEERQKEYRRIANSLELLAGNAAQATGAAELDLVLARRRDLLKKYPQETCFRKFETSLEDAVSRQRAQLALNMPSNSLIEDAEPDDPQATVISRGDSGLGVAREKPTIISEPSLETRKPLRWLALPAIVLASLAAVMVVPRRIAIQAIPSMAAIQVDNQTCGTPCVVKLRWGKHRLLARAAGFEDLRATIEVPLFSTTLPIIQLQSIPAVTQEQSKGFEPSAAQAPVPPKTAETVPSAPASENAKLLVRTSVPGALVFVDSSSSPAGVTGRNGTYQFQALAGPHRVRVEKQGFEKTAPQMVTLNTQKETVTFFDLRPTAQPASTTALPPATSQSNAVRPGGPVIAQPSASVAPADAFIIVNAPAGAEIQVDEQVVGHSTGGPFKARVQPGQRAVGIFLPGYQPFSKSLSVASGAQANLMANLTPLASVPSSLPPVHTSSGVTDDDRKQIQQLLDRYADGYSQKNLHQIQMLWPSIPTDTVKAIKEFFKSSKSVNMKIRLADAVPAGKRVTVECTQTLQYQLDGKQSVHSTSLTIYVLKNDTGWQIDFIPVS